MKNEKQTYNKTAEKELNALQRLKTLLLDNLRNKLKNDSDGTYRAKVLYRVNEMLDAVDIIMDVIGEIPEINA
ncbi:MAG: hypothetical protein FWE01_01510 [Firmicutes bacterium]|nr:hypothetical protein [Bacillota bacterium]